MPLLDHFHPPLSSRRDWNSFFSMWTTRITGHLNVDILPEEHFASPRVKMGRSLEEDIEPEAVVGREQSPGTVGGFPPAVEAAAEFVFPDDFEARVYSTTAGPTLVGAIELATPGNKDCPEMRRGFAAKVVSHLHRKVGVVVVDIVTDCRHNLHDEVCDLLGLAAKYRFDPNPGLYAVAYRPVRRPNGDYIEMWHYPLAVGSPLPVVPLGLRNSGIVPVDLGMTYDEACRGSRLPMAEL